MRREKLWAWALRNLQRRCDHPSKFVTADLNEGCNLPLQTQWCRLCGAYRFAASGSFVETWTPPRPDWWLLDDPHLFQRTVKRWLTFALVLLAVGCTPKVPPQPPGLPCGGSCPPNLTCVDGKCVDACAGVTCPPGVPCRDGLCHAIPPPPKEPKYLDMLLRTCGTGQFCVDGKPVDHAGCEACCMAWEDGRSGWPLFSVEFADYCREKGRSTFLHARPGPFLAADEPEWAGIGGPYVEVGGKADLTRFNEPFWIEVDRITNHAG